MNSPLVLVVEDDDSIRTTLCAFLDEEGYGVYEARNGREALEYLEGSGNRLPSLILLDLLMPEITGWQVLSELSDSDRLRTIPVAAMSGVAVLNAHGVVKFIRKPFDLDSLLPLIERYCGPRQPEGHA